MPNLVDMNFSKSVVYIYEHDAQGAMGLVINKPLTITLGSVLRQIDIEIPNTEIDVKPVFMGGPMAQDLGFVVHTVVATEALSATLEVDKIAISTSKEMLQNIAAGNGPENYLVALGYAGWEVGQLEQELAQNDWLIAPFNMELLFNTPIDKRWKRAIELLGFDIHHLTDQIGHA